MVTDLFKILITDDDIDLRELLTEAVGNWGYPVSVARNGEEALRKLRMEKYDIVITDLMMPGMDGLKLLSKVKELDKDILVIIITGYATIETAVKAIESGAYDYIAKPFRLDELMIVVRNACERLRLTSHNKALLDELRSAYGEVSILKRELARSTRSTEADEDGDDVNDSDTGSHFRGSGEQPDPLKQREYVKEADRFLKARAPYKT